MLGILLYTDSAHLFCIKLINEAPVFEYIETEGARGITIDTFGYIYVADTVEKNIRRFTADGKFSKRRDKGNPKKSWCD